MTNFSVLRRVTVTLINVCKKIIFKQTYIKWSLKIINLLDPMFMFGYFLFLDLVTRQSAALSSATKHAVFENFGEK